MTKRFISGVVEGFYGCPWTANERSRLFSWMREWELNTYLYAPKDDLKHRAAWRELYSGGEIIVLKALIDRCRASGVQFVYAIAPGLDAAFAGPEAARALVQKAEQLLSLGCEQFALSFDDIVPMTGSDGRTAAEAMAFPQAKVANEFYRFLRGRRGEAELFFCPTLYCARMSGPVADSLYLKILGEKLAPEIHVFWTGPEIVSETISVESVEELSRVLHRAPVIWDNLHANDYDMRRVYLGPYAGRPIGLRERVDGIISNPNCEFEVNFVALRTLAQFCRATGAWDPRREYRAALCEWWPEWRLHGLEEELGGKGLISLEDLELIGDCFYLPFATGRSAEELLAHFTTLLRTPPAAWGDAYHDFVRLCSRVERIFTRFTELGNRDLMHALYRRMWELKEEIHLLAGYVEWLRAGPAAGEHFYSAEHRPKTYRGGFLTEMRRLLPMDANGGFDHLAAAPTNHDRRPLR